MIVTNDAKLAERARKFAGLGYRHLTAAGGTTSLSATDFQHPGYARFDTIGLNYRMSWAQANRGLSILHIAKAKVEVRQQIGYLWQHALGCQLQPHNYDADNTFYSAAWPFPHQGPDTVKKWREFQAEYVRRGGDSFYAMPLPAYEEPALLSTYAGLEPCKVATDLQRRLMLMKTHYNTLQEAKKQIDILSDMMSNVPPLQRVVQ